MREVAKELHDSKASSADFGGLLSGYSGSKAVREALLSTEDSFFDTARSHDSVKISSKTADKR